MQVVAAAGGHRHPSPALPTSGATFSSTLPLHGRNSFANREIYPKETRARSMNLAASSCVTHAWNAIALGIAFAQYLSTAGAPRRAPLGLLPAALRWRLRWQVRRRVRLALRWSPRLCKRVAGRRPGRRPGGGLQPPQIRVKTSTPGCSNRHLNRRLRA